MSKQSPKSPGKPNIIVFLTDDHAQWALGCYGHSEIRSPNIDQLASEGILFEDAYTPSPVCSPARASFLTGLMPSAHGVHDWLDGRKGHPGIQDETLGGMLMACGYSTALFGKWHCGSERQPYPGWDRWFSYWESQYPHKGSIAFSDNGKKDVRVGHQSHLVVDEAVRFLRHRQEETPFFMVVGLVNTHYPWADMPERWVKQYQDATFRDLPAEPIDPNRHPDVRIGMPDDAVERKAINTQYYAAVSTIDEQVGRVMDELETQGIEDNTLIVYTSDHGHINGKHGLLTKGNATIPQNFLEESIRIPLILRWPEAHRAKTRHAGPVDLCDLHRTLLEVAGSPELPARAAGESFASLLNGERGFSKDAQFCEYGNARMVKCGDDKLVERYPGPNGAFPNEYYHLGKDPDERQNLYEQMEPEVKNILHEQIVTFFEGHSREATDGRLIAAQPVCNEVEPWRA